MAAGGDQRARLIVPVATIISLMWTASGIVALLQNDARIFEICSGPFALMCGYVFGVRLTRAGYEDTTPPTTSKPTARKPGRGRQP